MSAVVWFVVGMYGLTIAMMVAQLIWPGRGE